MQAAVKAIIRERNRTLAAIKTAQAEQRGKAYITALEQSVSELDCAMSWIAYGDSQRTAMARLQLLLEHGSTDNGISTDNRRRNRNRRASVPNRRHEGR